MKNPTIKHVRRLTILAVVSVLAVPMTMTAVEAQAASSPAVTSCSTYYSPAYKQWFPEYTTGTPRKKFTRVKPRRFFYQCGGFNRVDVKWRKYGKRTALGRATVRWQHPKYSYENVVRTTRNVKIRLKRVRKMRQHRQVRVFTRLIVSSPNLPKRLTGTFSLKASGPGEGRSCSLGFQRERLNNRYCPPVNPSRYYRDKSGRFCYAVYNYGNKKVYLWLNVGRHHEFYKLSRASKNVYFKGPKSVPRGGTRYVFTKSRLTVSYAFGEGTGHFSRTARC